MQRLMVAVAVLFGLTRCCAGASAQDRNQYSRANTFEVFASGAYTSSHILLGGTRNRQLGGFGVGYARRVLHSKAVDLSYLAELRPVLLESDPFVHERDAYVSAYQGTDGPYIFDYKYRIVSKCTPESGRFVLNTSAVYYYALACGRERTFAQAFQPLGFKLAGRTRHALQPTLAGTLGYMYSNGVIPVDNAGSFNFVFDFGPGVEIYRDKGRSLNVEYRFHHFSNHYTAPQNPGTDMMMLKVGYNFGR